MDWKDKRVLILGLAREGESLALYLHSQGARVTVTDSASEDVLKHRVAALGANIHCELGGTFPHLVSGAEYLFVSPGVPEINEVYRAAREAGIPIRSMTTLFFDLCPGQILGVTGSSGKTTTTSLIGHILRTAGKDCVVGGNIGDAMLDLLPAIKPGTIVVLELSSFQLSLLQRSPHIAVVTNISPNHLDRHGSMEAYIDAKKNIVRFQSPHDHAILNAADRESQQFAGSTEATISWFGRSLPGGCGSTVLDGWVGIRTERGDTRIIMESEITLPGDHNLENVLAAVAASEILAVDPSDVRRAIRTFKAPAHRLQPVLERGGVRFIDDSIATSPSRATVALRAIPGPVLLIAGGREKNLPWDEFVHVVVKKVRALFLIGEAAHHIRDEVRQHLENGSQSLKEDAIRICDSLQLAVKEASEMARVGDVVLLSPGCTSYDMFADYEERGDAFARAVEALDAA
ncbi:MAG: UDP-N-acetylmuramoyl-L-alanine--D-glutamate ligase [Chloroflexota bacterium]